jgi:voltage-gated potassium channel
LLTAATVLVHGFGTLGLVSRISKNWEKKWSRASLLRLQFLLARIVMVLFILHMLEAAIWAGFYFWSGALPDLHTAFYFSICSYTTVGYGDVVLSPEWRLVGAFESCVGVIMLGWSTGILFAMVSRQFEMHLRFHRPEH